MSVRKLTTGYQGQYRDAAGRRHTQMWPTRTAAVVWAADGAAAVRVGTHRDPRAGRLTFAAWHARWDAARVIEDSTRRVAKSYTPGLLQQWGHWPLSAITRLEVQGWVRRLEREGRGPYAIEKLAQLLTSTLEAAVDEDLLPSNPARRVTLPRRTVTPVRVITQAEEQSLLEVLPTDRDRWMVEVFLDTGLRYGELAGLHGHRVDLLRAEVRVVEVLTQAGKIKPYPKTTAGQRVVPLTKRAVLALSQAMTGQGRDGLVFHAHRRSPGTDTFGPVVGANWRRNVWTPSVERAGLAKPWPTPHSCRHTCLTRLAAAGVDVRTVQAFAGHGSLTTTYRYLHAQPDAHDKVRRALGG